MENIIHYGFGRDYLPNWKTKQALREVYQNFLDFGNYTEDFVYHEAKNEITIILENDYIPENLEFLRIGNSDKSGNNEAIGKHGEGLKMALLIFLRQNNKIELITSQYIIKPYFYTTKEIGECFGIKYYKNKTENRKFIIKITCRMDEFESFHKGILKKDDYLFEREGQGSIVDKEKGNIYSGGLFVCKFKNFSNAYDILPSKLPLDRDREVPKSFDVYYHSSKINEAYDKWSTNDMESDDTTYINYIPDRIKEKIKPIIIGNSIEFVTKKENNETKVISNINIKDRLKSDGFFKGAIKKLKSTLMKRLGLYDLLVEFKDNHVHSKSAIEDFNIILQKIKQ